jgi:hypothetical protein
VAFEACQVMCDALIVGEVMVEGCASSQFFNKEEK